MRILLKGGLLDGQTRRVPLECIQFSARVGGKRVVYKNTRSAEPGSGDVVFDWVPDDPMDEGEERWRGIDIKVFKDRYEPNTYRVEFWPRTLQSIADPSGGHPRVPHPARVIVQSDQELRVSRSDPPEWPIPHLDREDYEAKALEAVREEIAGEPESSEQAG